MPPLILWGAILFTLALIFYSISIWSNFFIKHLKPWHVVLFALGVITDALGTLFMYLNVGVLIFTPHSISGFLGLFLMIFHFLWAYFNLKNNTPKHALFHKLSLIIWAFWMISYISGVYLGLQHL